MVIGALDKLTLLDYPGELAAIIFTQGCNFRCHFCYNPMLVVPESHGKASNKDYPPKLSEGNLFSFLKNRIGKIDAVVISGGEPTIHSDLPAFISRIKSIGYKIKLDTNGTNSSILNHLIKERLIDYVAMDIKAPIDKYKDIVNTSTELHDVEKSIKILIEGSIPYEFRTTALPKVHNINDFEEMGKMIHEAKLWYLQNFRGNTELINPNFKKELGFTSTEIAEILKIGNKYVNKFILR